MLHFFVGLGGGEWSGHLHLATADAIEDQLTRSLLNCPLCAQKEPCLVECKAGGKSWKECLGECLADNPPMQSMFVSLSEKMHRRKSSSTVAESSSSGASSANGSYRKEADVTAAGGFLARKDVVFAM